MGIFSLQPVPNSSHAEIGAQSVEVDEMTQEEAMDFLLQRARIIDRASSYTSALQSDQNMARTITETLGRLPLALDQAGAYMQRTQCGLSGYYDSYQKEHEKLLHYRGTRVAYPHSVASTWSLNFEKVREANPIAIDLLYLLHFFILMLSLNRFLLNVRRSLEQLWQQLLVI